jgi:hypothetical protein
VKRPVYKLEGVERRVWVRGVHKRGESLISLSHPTFESDEQLALKVAGLMHSHLLPSFHRWGATSSKIVEIHVRRRGRSTKIYEFSMSLHMGRVR